MSTKKLNELLPTLLGVRKAIEYIEGTFSDNIESDMVCNLGLKGFDTKEKDEKGIGNPIRPTEKIYLREGETQLGLKYGLCIVGISDNLEIISSKELHTQFKELINNLRERSVEGVSILRLIAAAYAYNIYIGAPGFRNRDNCSNLSSTINFKELTENGLEEGTVSFKGNGRMLERAPFNKNLENIIDSNHPALKLLEEESEDKLAFNKIVNMLETSLKNDRSSNSYLELKVETKYTLMEGSLVYPSEIFPGEKDKDQKMFYKTLSSRKEYYGLTPEKVNNALRTIDSFFTAEASVSVTPIEPTAANLKLNSILRGKDSDIFYYLNKILNSNDISVLSDKEVFFVLGNFIRGGLFNGSKTVKAKPDPKTKEKE